MLSWNLEELISKSFDANSYLAFFETLVANKKTTGSAQTKFMIEYTANNLAITKKCIEEIPQEKLNALSSKIKQDTLWVLFTEPWCSDAAYSAAVFISLAAINPHVQLRILLRDENNEIFDNYLTANKRQIPKLVVFNTNTLEEIFTWGARPKKLNDILKKLIEEKGHIHINEKKLLVHQWYMNDKQVELFKELDELIP